MKRDHLFKILRSIRDFGHDGPTLQRRLFAFFLLFLAAVMSALLLTLFAAGVFSAGLKESRIFLENELHHIAGSAEKDLGAVAVQGVGLSGRLTEHIEKALDERGLTPSDFGGSPECLEPLLDGCLDILRAALEKNKVSAVFLALDATVNPALEAAASSRAGLFLRNMAANAAYESPSAVRYMRGPISIARARNMYLLPQWEMEFTVSPGDFFHTARDAAGGDLELSRLYYWSPKSVLPGDYAEAMLLAVPLVAGDGTVLGVCGFEIDGMLFKMQYTPDNTTFSGIFSLLAPVRGDGTLDASQAMLAGSYTAVSAGIDGTLEIGTKKNGLSYFTGPDSKAYAGLYRPVSLYPKGAVHGGPWIFGVVMPQEDLADYMTARSRAVLILLFTLFLLSAGAAFILSRRYISPIVAALGKIRRPGPPDYGKTNIQEIDDLLSFLAEQDKLHAQVPPPAENPRESSALFDDFVRNIGTLSPAERSVFNLYLEGYGAKEIAEMLCLSINTIKTHNKRIYMKLNVSSRSELLLYVKLMRENERRTADAGY